MKRPLTFIVSLPGRTPRRCARHALVQSFPHEVGVEEHEGHDGHPAAELSRAQLLHHAGDVAVAPEDGRRHDPAGPQEAEQRPRLQQPGLAPQRVTAPAGGAAVAGLGRAAPRFQRRGEIRRAGAVDGLLRHRHGDEHAGHEDEDEEREEALGLAAEVNGQHAAAPVQRRQQVSHAAPQADHEGEHGEGLTAVLLVTVEVGQERLQRREAHLTAEVKEPHPQDEEPHLEHTGGMWVGLLPPQDQPTS